jgi:hypothetical protein
MKNKNFLLSLLLLLNFTNMGFSQTKFVEQKAGHIVYLSIPDYFIKTNTLNDVAVMQYLNNAKEAYLVVIEDSKEDLELAGAKYENLKEFHDGMIKNLKTEENKAEETTPVEFQQNGNTFYQSELRVVLKEEDGKSTQVTYLCTYIQSKTHYYQILCWTLTPNFKGLVKDFKQIVLTIRD